MTETATVTTTAADTVTEYVALDVDPSLPAFCQTAEYPVAVCCRMDVTEHYRAAEGSELETRARRVYIPMCTPMAAVSTFITGLLSELGAPPTPLSVDERNALPPPPTDVFVVPAYEPLVDVRTRPRPGAAAAAAGFGAPEYDDADGVVVFDRRRGVQVPVINTTSSNLFCGDVISVMQIVDCVYTVVHTIDRPCAAATATATATDAAMVPPVPSGTAVTPVPAHQHPLRTVWCPHTAAMRLNTLLSGIDLRILMRAAHVCAFFGVAFPAAYAPIVKPLCAVSNGAHTSHGIEGMCRIIPGVGDGEPVPVDTIACIVGLGAVNRNYTNMTTDQIKEVFHGLVDVYYDEDEQITMGM